MKKELKMILGLMAFLAIFFITLPIGAVAPTVTIGKVTDSPDNAYPEGTVIFGDKIVYSDDRDGNYNLYVYDISSSEETQITNSAGSEKRPAIFGDIVAWEDSRSGDGVDVYRYDMSAVEPAETLVTNSGGDARDVDVYGDVLVWEDNRNGNLDIYMYDISEAEETRITSDAQDQQNPGIWGNIIVWEDSRDGLNEIYKYDISDQTETRLTNNLAGVGDPDIYEQKVAYTDYSENTDVYILDLNSLEATRLTTDPDAQDQPKISENFVAWRDDRTETDSIYFYDLLGEEEVRLTTNDHLYAEYISVSGNRVVWDSYDGTYNYSNVYYATLNYPEPSDTTDPTYQTLPGDTRTINLTEGELIKTNPYIIKVKPNDDTAIEKVEFYVDGTLICTDTTADSEGVYECAWDTSKYHSDIRVVAYDTSGNTVESTRSVTVDPSLYTLPQTGMKLWDYLRYLVNALKGLVTS